MYHLPNINGDKRINNLYAKNSSLAKQNYLIGRPSRYSLGASKRYKK